MAVSILLFRRLLGLCDYVFRGISLRKQLCPSGLVTSVILGTVKNKKIFVIYNLGRLYIWCSVTSQHIMSQPSGSQKVLSLSGVECKRFDFFCGIDKRSEFVGREYAFSGSGVLLFIDGKVRFYLRIIQKDIAVSEVKGMYTECTISLRWEML